MKRNRLHSFVVLALLLTLFLSACGESEIPYDTSLDYSSEYGDGALYENPEQNQIQKQEAPALSENEPEQYGLEFDFYEAVQNIYLFGNKISLPCAFTEFGDNFSLNSSFMQQFDNVDQVITGLLYEGRYIGAVILQDCVLEDTDKESKNVIGLSLGNGAIYDDTLQAEFYGVSMINSTKEDTLALLGTPTPKDGAYFENRVAYQQSEHEYIYIEFVGDRIVEFIFIVGGY